MTNTTTNMAATGFDEEQREFVDGWREGLARERDVVRFIKKHLLTDEQKRQMDAWGWSVEEILNGGNEGQDGLESVQDQFVDDLFTAWNVRMNTGMHDTHRYFGF